MEQKVSRTPRAPRLRLDVTGEIICDSTKRKSDSCMIAQAVKAAYPDAAHVAVDIQTIRFSDMKKGYRFTYLTPRVGQLAIIQFDQGNPPEPFRLLLRNGQVTLAGKRPPKQKSTDAQIEGRTAGLRASREQLKKAKLALDRTDAMTHCNKVPDKIGGKPPPTAAGKRREFGLRALQY